MKKELITIEKKILKHLSQGRLPILDEIKDDNKMYYKGITWDYICKYVLEGQYDKNKVGYVLLKLLSEKKIRSIYCADVSKQVFGDLSTELYTFPTAIFNINDDKFTGNDQYSPIRLNEYHLDIINSYKLIKEKLQIETEMVSA